MKPQRNDDAKDVKPFRLVEDLEWREKMEIYTGKFQSDNPGSTEATSNEIPIVERDGSLWKFARFLMESGFVLDTKGYSSCFRVNMKQQNLPEDRFQALLDGRIKIETGLASSVNLSCVDIYPSTSGKKNSCQYLAEKLAPNTESGTILASDSFFLCDDDNDIEMAMACRHAFCPQVSSASMLDTIRKHPKQFTTFLQYSDNTKATEMALRLVLDRLEENLETEN